MYCTLPISIQEYLNIKNNNISCILENDIDLIIDNNYIFKIIYNKNGGYHINKSPENQILLSIKIDEDNLFKISNETYKMREISKCEIQHAIINTKSIDYSNLKKIINDGLFDMYYFKAGSCLIKTTNQYYKELFKDVKFYFTFNNIIPKILLMILFIIESIFYVFKLPIYIFANIFLTLFIINLIISCIIIQCMYYKFRKIMETINIYHENEKLFEEIKLCYECNNYMAILLLSTIFIFGFFFNIIGGLPLYVFRNYISVICIVISIISFINIRDIYYKSKKIIANLD